MTLSHKDFQCCEAHGVFVQGNMYGFVDRDALAQGFQEFQNPLRFRTKIHEWPRRP